MRLFVRALCLAVWATVLALPGPALAQTAVEFRPAGGGFRVEFPGKFSVRTEDVNTRLGPTRVVTAEWVRADGGKCYAVHTRHFSGDMGEDPQRTFDRLRIGRTVKGNVRSEQRFLLENNPAQRQIVDWTGATRPVIVALDVARRGDLYSIFCIVDRGQEAMPDVQGYMNSFALLPL